MLRLSLLRHAKSSWVNPDLNDHERPLTKRGTKAAIRIGRYINGHHLTPELIICSDATRTRATLALIIDALDQPWPDTIITNKLYLATTDAILRLLNRYAGTADHVMIIGHNPGLQEVASSLAATAKNQADLERLATKYPTAALAQIAFNLEDWSKVKPATGSLERFITPRTLTD